MTEVYIVLAVFTMMVLMAIVKKPSSVYNNDPSQKNPVEGKKVVFVEDESERENADGVRGHLQVVGEADRNSSFYDRIVKRILDIVLSFCGLVVLSPVFLALSLWIVIDDPGSVLFTQKRIGKNKQYFKLHKFRSMKIGTPHDRPTHMLKNPEQYITRAGKFIRAHSLDELPQIWDIFIGNMSVIGPRPGLWNQDLLTSYRDQYGANDIKPGLTGWAQINGRDELEIPIKARLDGEYVEKESFLFDCRCFLGTVFSVARGNGVVEGGTGELHKHGSDKSLFENEKGVTVSIVTYNNSDEIDKLMASIQENLLFSEMTVYVIDNDSDDNTVGIIRERYPWARVIENEENVGFGRAHNIAIKNVHSKYHIIVNPDISLEADAIARSVAFMNDNSDTAVMTPYVMNIDGTQQFLPKKTPSMKYLIGGMFESRFQWGRKLRDEYTMRNEIISAPTDVEFCTGAFMVTRTEALQQVGGFDERYFLHFEDADLTRELRKVGRAVYNPDIKVTHGWRRENKKINKSFWVAMKSMFIYMNKWRGSDA